MRPIGNYLLARPVEPERHVGVIALPDSAVLEVQDALVTAVGPGRLLDSGRHYPLQARVGDRVVYCQHHVKAHVDGQLLLDDRDLVAILPGPDHTEIHPANDYVFVLPDAAPTQTASGLLLSTHSMAGAEVGDLETRNRLLDTWRHLRAKWMRDGEPFSEQVRLGKNWVKGLKPQEQRLFAEVLQEDQAEAYVDQRTLEALRPPRRVVPVVTGRLLDVGPGKVIRSGDRWSLGMLDHLEAAISTGRVVWDRQHQATDVFVDGQRLIALQAKYVQAALGESA
jgi:chaperonin GroES